MNAQLKDKHVLITAGPTWVPIDKVRVITNIFGGALGSIIADEALFAGAKVTLLFGPGAARLPKENSNLKVVRYKYYEELLTLMENKLKKNSYDAVIHSAAVSDYTPVDVSDGKIKSGEKELIIHFKPTLKIVDIIKKISPNVFLIKFKLEVGISDDELIKIARKSMSDSSADMIVANEFSTVSNDHKAFVINKNMDPIMVKGKEKIAQKIIEELSIQLKKRP